jgi:hypothetical protein
MTNHNNPNHPNTLHPAVLTPAEKQALAKEAKERALTRRLSDARLIEEALAVAQRAVVMRYVVEKRYLDPSGDKTASTSLKKRLDIIQRLQALDAAVAQLADLLTNPPTDDAADADDVSESEDA